MPSEQNGLIESLLTLIKTHYPDGPAGGADQFYGEVEAYLQDSPTGVLIWFSPAQAATDQLETVVADLQEIQKTLLDAGIGTLGVASLEQLLLENIRAEYRIDFPLLGVTAHGDLPCEIWQQLTKVADCDLDAQARLYHFSQDGGAAEQIFSYQPGELGPVVLGYLTAQGLIQYAPEFEPVKIAEQGHLVQRRAIAAQETVANLDERIEKLKRELAKTANPVAKEQLDRLQAAGDGFVNLTKRLDKTAATRPAVGLAFSGGGIRSASFNLGLLQGLAKYRILPWVDYLTSVSGGGFTAAALTSLLSKRPRSRVRYFNTQWEKFPFNPRQRTFEARVEIRPKEARGDRNYRDVSFEPGENTQLAYLRDKGNYLVPRLGWITRDLLRGVGGSLAGTAFTVISFFLALLIFSASHYFLTATLSPNLLKNIDTSRLATPDSAAAFNLVSLIFADYVTAPPYTAQEGVVPPAPPLIPWFQYGVIFLAGFFFSIAVFLLLARLYHFKNLHQWEKGKVSFKALRYLPPGLLIVAFILLQILLIADRVYRRPAALLYPLILLAPWLILLYIFRGLSTAGFLKTRRWPLFSASALLVVLGGLLIGRVSAPSQLFTQPASENDWTLVVFLCLLFGGLWYGLETRLRHDRWEGDGLARREQIDDFILKVLVGLGVGILGLAVVGVRLYFRFLEGMGSALPAGLRSGINLSFSGPQVYWALMPVLFLAGSVIAIGLVHFYRPQDIHITWGNEAFRSIFWAYSGLNYYLLIITVVLTGLILPNFFAVSAGEESGITVPAATALLSALWAAYLSAAGRGEASGDGGVLKKIFSLPGGIRNILLGLLVIVLNLSVIYLFEALIDRFFTTPLQVFGLGLGALGLLVMIGGLANFNYLTPHYFFRDRMAEVFMRTEFETPEGQVVVARDDRDKRLDQLAWPESSVPYFLVVTAVNLPGSWRLKYKDRKSQHFIFSREFCGSDLTGYARTKDYQAGRLKYGETIGLSGAAASSSLGYVTFFAQAFMMTLLNVRLGLWLVNPRRYARRFRSELPEEAAKDANLDLADRAFWPTYLWDEARGATHERRSMVNITDGGHTGDNAALYPLFQRRCEVIIAGDASQDPEGLCKDLFRVIHYVKVDLGIEVRINVEGLIPAKTDNAAKIEPGLSRHHCAVGKITYPAVYRADGSLKLPEEKGWLIYFKPAITGAEPATIKQYWDTHRSQYPHPDTADQFFDELQFEAQRHLGEVSVEHTLRALGKYYREKKKQATRRSDILHTLLEDQVVDYGRVARDPGVIREMIGDLRDAISPEGDG